MTEEKKRTRAPSDPVASAAAIILRMSPDMLHALGLTVADKAPLSAGILQSALSNTAGPV